MDRIYSFDIFDTCLTRRCGDPKTVFEILSRRVFRDSVPSEIYRAFIVARIEAENESYSNAQTLTDIYNTFRFSHPLLVSKEELLKSEMQVEREMLSPIIATKKIISDIRNKGHRVLFISDMYLPGEFLASVLLEYGIMKEGDSIYVSCEQKSTKTDGSLFQIVRNKEKLNYNTWHHYGDNKHSDFDVPRKLGIHANHITYQYSPYQEIMHHLPALSFQYGMILAGLCRSILLEEPSHPHKDIVIDLIAPLFASFVYRVLKNAKERGINALYFCARDAYPLYRIAKTMSTLFPDLTIEYLYISRKSLYEGDSKNKIGYFTQIGLATHNGKNAIVDMRSSGRTLNVLNNLLREYGFNSVSGYFLEISSTSISERKEQDYYADIDDMYINNMNSALRRLPSNWYMYELFFPLNTQRRTIGYQCKDGLYQPILSEVDEKEYRLNNVQEWVGWRNYALDSFTEWFIRLGLHKHADSIFEQYAIPQLAQFFSFPEKRYLKALSELYGMNSKEEYLPYIDNSSLRLPINIIRHRTIWKRGTIFYTLPRWLTKLLYRHR